MLKVSVIQQYGVNKLLMQVVTVHYSLHYTTVTIHYTTLL